jgi:hemerythrin-like domain-containing protein
VAAIGKISPIAPKLALEVNAMSASDPLAILKHGHDVGIEKLKLLTEAVSGLDGGSNPAALESLKEVFLFFDGELRIHFRQEEEVLFPAMERAIGRDGPIAAMLDVHQSLWRAVDSLKDNMEQFENAADGGLRDISREIKLIGTHIVGLLGSHIEQENGMILPLAERSLSAATLQGVAEGMAGVGRDSG